MLKAVLNNDKIITYVESDDRFIKMISDKNPDLNVNLNVTNKELLKENYNEGIYLIKKDNRFYLYRKNKIVTILYYFYNQISYDLVLEKEWILLDINNKDKYFDNDDIVLNELDINDIKYNTSIINICPSMKDKNNKTDIYKNIVKNLIETNQIKEKDITLFSKDLWKEYPNIIHKKEFNISDIQNNIGLFEENSKKIIIIDNISNSNSVRLSFRNKDMIDFIKCSKKLNVGLFITLQFPIFMKDNTQKYFDYIFINKPISKYTSKILFNRYNINLSHDDYFKILDSIDNSNNLVINNTSNKILLIKYLK